MKHLITLLLTLLVLGGCTNEVPSHLLIENGGVTFEVNSKSPFTGTSIQYDSIGNLDSKKYFKEGIKVGETTFDYNWSGQLLVINNYMNGRKDGLQEEYFTTGQLKSKSNYKNGKLVGTWKRYNKKGEDISNGFYEAFHKNGQLKEEGKYSNGNYVGTWKNFYDNGQLRGVRNYSQAGLRDGNQTSYYKNGQIQYKGRYKNGLMHGIWLNYEENGRQSYRCFRNGNQVQVPGSSCEIIIDQ